MIGAPSIVVMGGTVAAAADIARRAERAGFRSAWTTEFYDRSATITLAAMAAVTDRIELGSGIAYGVARTPLVLAAEARDLDEISEGRLILGLGTGTARMRSDWHGLDPSGPAPRMEELAGLLRALWRLHERPVEHEGRFYRCRIRPTSAMRAPLRQAIPIYLAGVRPRMIEAAGAVADGLVGHPIATPEYTQAVVRPALARGALRADRDPHVPIAGYVICAIHDDAAVARREAAGQIAFYATVKAYDGIHRLHGFEREVAEIREAWRAGDARRMVGSVSDAMVDAIAVHGTPDEVRDRFAARFDGVYERPLLYSPTFGLEPERARENLFAICETFAAPIRPLAAPADVA